MNEEWVPSIMSKCQVVPSLVLESPIDKVRYALPNLGFKEVSQLILGSLNAMTITRRPTNVTFGSKVTSAVSTWEYSGRRRLIIS